VMKSPGSNDRVYAPWQGAGRALHPCGRSTGTRSCAHPGRIGWCRSSPVVSPPANFLSPFGTDAVALETFQDLHPTTPHGRSDPSENAINPLR
jgi:hypothetical protein